MLGKVRIGALLAQLVGLGGQPRTLNQSPDPRVPLLIKFKPLANAYRTIASGILAQPYVIRKIVRNSNLVAVATDGISSYLVIWRYSLASSISGWPLAS